MTNETHAACHLMETTTQNPTSQSALLDQQEQKHLGASGPPLTHWHQYLHFNKSPSGLKCTFKLENGLDNKASKTKCY